MISIVNILVVDDNKKIRRLMEIYLKREGFEVLHADNGAAAMKVLEKISASLIIADIMMPEKDGYEMAQEIRDYGYTMPILMVTAKETYFDKKKGFETGADDYMTKPVDMEEMILRVKALLRRAKISYDEK